MLKTKHGIWTIRFHSGDEEVKKVGYERGVEWVEEHINALANIVITAFKEEAKRELNAGYTYRVAIYGLGIAIGYQQWAEVNHVRFNIEKRFTRFYVAQELEEIIPFLDDLKSQ